MSGQMAKLEQKSKHFGHFPQLCFGICTALLPASVSEFLFSISKMECEGRTLQGFLSWS